MPSTAEAAAITDSYRRRLGQTRDAAAEGLAAGLAQVDLDLTPAALERQLRVWTARGAGLLDAAADRATLLSVAYLSAYVRASGVDDVPVATTTRRPPGAARAVEIARIGLLWRLGRGDGREMALRTATTYALRGARTHTMDAARQSLGEAMVEHPQVRGWRRVTAGTTDEFCASRAGVLLEDQADVEAHPGCRCTAEPVLRQVPERVQRAAPETFPSRGGDSERQEP
jgi:hypothetical protein